jgi:transposase
VQKRQVSTEWKRVREFLRDIQERSRPEGGFVAILEVCGFNDWLLKLLAEYGCRETVLIQPEKRSKRKTDRRDAHALVVILWVNRQRLLAGKRVQGVRRVWLPGQQDAEDRQLTALRVRLGQLRTRTRNKLKHILRKHNLEQECPTKGLDTVRAKKWLAQVSLGPIDRLAMDQLLVQEELWEEQIEKLEAEIVARQAKSKKAGILATIPGCGAYSSLALACRIGEIERFPGRGSLANYWGLTPGCRNSGEANDRLGSITKQGSAIARFMLGELVLHVVRRDPWMKQWYGKIKRRRGSKIGRVAVMRRLVDVCEQMIRGEQPYVIGGPAARQQATKPADSPRHGKVSKGAKKTASGRKVPPEADAPLAHLDPAIPRRVASPQSPTPLHRARTL